MESDEGVHMTRRTNARLAGFTFLFYIAAGIGSIVFASSPPGRVSQT